MWQGITGCTRVSRHLHSSRIETHACDLQGNKKFSCSWALSITCHYVTSPCFSPQTSKHNVSDPWPKSKLLRCNACAQVKFMTSLVWFCKNVLQIFSDDVLCAVLDKIFQQNVSAANSQIFHQISAPLDGGLHIEYGVNG